MLLAKPEKQPAIPDKEVQRGRRTALLFPPFKEKSSCLLLHPDNYFDKTRELTYPLLIALLIPAHPLLFSFWKYSFSDTRDRLKINRLSLSKLFVSLSKEFINRPKIGYFPMRSRVWENLHQSCSSPR